MVLSNKKLKQKLRAELTEPSSEAKPESQSLKLRPRLSKREKRRESLPEKEDSEKEKKVRRSDEGSDEREKQKKKRKREKENGAEENGAVSKREKTGEEVEKTKKKKKKKSTKKKKFSNRRKKEKQDKEEKQKMMSEEENHAAIEKQDHSPIEENSETKVYAGGIPYYSTEDDIRSFFESCGTITEIDCMKFPETGKFRGIAIINFKTDAAAKRALALDGSDMGGLYLTIQPYKANRAAKSSDFAPKVVEGYYRIYAGNLAWDITEDKLRNFFTDCKISSVRFGNDKNTGEFRGYAHVDFLNSVSFTMALKMDQKVICGRPIRLRCAVPLKKEATDAATTGPTTVPTPTETAPPSSEPTRDEPVETDLPLSSTGTGKMKRRTCYECGDKGHISSDCPKKKTAVSVPETISRTETSFPSSVPLKAPISETSYQSSAHASTDYFSREHVPVAVETAEVNAGLSGVSAGKLRRRTCYECGEKGHISSDCPKKLTT